MSLSQKFKQDTDAFILTNVSVVDPSTKTEGPRELWIEKGVIKEVGPTGAWSGKGGTTPPAIDGEGHTCMPGLIDLHTHLREPGQEYKETIATGTLAAAAGGFTSVLCMANTAPINDNPYVTRFIRSQAEAHGHVRVYPVGALSKGLNGEQMAEIGKMRDAGIVAVSDDGNSVMNSYLMRKALDYCRAFGLPIFVHAEDAHLVGKGVMHEGYYSNRLGLRGIPAEAEEIMVARDIALARLTGGKIHFCHISTKSSLDHIRRAKSEGLAVTAEVTPHHLCLTDEDVSEYDSNFKMLPPLRTAEDREALIEALRDGTIDCIATDHAPHAPRDKDVLFEFAANGVVGLESALPVGLSLVQQGKLPLARLIEALSTAPAKIAAVPGGSLKAGTPADFNITDLNQEFELTSDILHSRSHNTPHLGTRFRGRVLATFVGGKAKWLL